jgi:hypothetical protein
MILISKTYAFLLSNKVSFPKYIGIAFFIELLPAVLLSVLLDSVISIFDLPFNKLPDLNLSWESFWIAVVIAPILETDLLILTLHILRSYKFQGLKLTIISAALIHAMNNFLTLAAGSFDI